MEERQATDLVVAGSSPAGGVERSNMADKGFFKKGDRVKIVNNIYGIITEEDGIVLKVNKRGVWLDNGVGNDPTGPFDRFTGQWEDNGVIPGASMKIRPRLDKLIKGIYSTGTCVGQ